MQIYRYSRSLLLNAIFICFSMLLTACAEEQSVSKPKARPVKIFTVGSVVSGTVEYPGEVSAALKAEMAFEVTGKIVKFPVKEGQKVNKGQLLAQLDLRDFQSTVSSAQGEYDQVLANYQRAEELIKNNYISKTDYDQIKAQLKTTQSNLNKAKKALEEATLIAPFAGQVAKKLVDDFANIQAKQAILVLQDSNSLEIVINVPEVDWVRAKPGINLEEHTRLLRPQVELSSMPGRRFDATIKEVSTTADPATRTYSATLAFPAPTDITVLPGMTAKCIIHVPDEIEAQNNEIPSKAVVSDPDGNAFVWRIDPENMSVSKATIKLGELSGSNVKILQGLNSGDQIAVSGVHQLMDGMQVTRFE